MRSTTSITDANRAHSGNNYLQVTVSTANVTAGALNELVAVSPGDKLTFGGWAYLESGTSADSAQWALEVLDANGNVLAYVAAGNATAASWTYESTAYTVPTGAVSVGLFCQINPTANGTSTARFDDGFLSGASGVGVHYYHLDHLGSTRLLTDKSGNQTWSAAYLPFGQEWNPQAATNHYKFTGYERDAETGNDYAVARQYGSRLGRFLQPDPAGTSATCPFNPQTQNRYAYVTDNPSNHTDPSGLCDGPGDPSCGPGIGITLPIFPGGGGNENPAPATPHPVFDTSALLSNFTANTGKSCARRAFDACVAAGGPLFAAALVSEEVCIEACALSGPGFPACAAACIAAGTLVEHIALAACGIAGTAEYALCKLTGGKY